MRNLIILKLGGSILTEKQRGCPIMREQLVRKIASTIARVVRSSSLSVRLVLLYGGGSFGHPLAHRFGLLNARLEKRTLIGFGRTTVAMRELGNRIAEIFLSAGLPVIPLQASSFVLKSGSRLRFADVTILETILGSGGIPLLGGDIVIADRTRTVVASADSLAVELAVHFRGAKLLFASDVRGVYKTFPPSRSDHPLARISRKELSLLARRATKITGEDVTGKMTGKLRALLALRGSRVIIFDGHVSGNFAAALKGKNIGTVIDL